MSSPNLPRLVEAPCNTPSPSYAELPIEEAYKRVREEIAAVDDAELVAVNIDLPTASGVVKAAVRRLAPLRDALVAGGRLLDPATFDRLADYADAAVYLHSEVKRQGAPEDATPALYDEAIRFRDSVVTLGRLLVQLELVEPGLFEQVGSVGGYRNVGVELIGLCTTLLQRLPALEGRCPLSEAQLLRGRALGNMLLEAADQRGVDTKRGTPLHKERQRAFSLLSRRYDDVRRAVTYLRWREDDADALAPSWYAGRGPSRTARAHADAEGAEPSADTTTPLLQAPPASTRPAARGAQDVDPPKGDSLFTPVSDEPFVDG